jgi:hypothetical protein
VPGFLVAKMAISKNKNPGFPPGFFKPISLID